MREFQFQELQNADLVIDAVYKGGTARNIGDDPLLCIPAIMSGHSEHRDHRFRAS
jgi:hypothetical protein